MMDLRFAVKMWTLYAVVNELSGGTREQEMWNKFKRRTIDET